MKTMINDRCEIIIATMYGGDFKEVSSKQIASWIGIQPMAALKFIDNIKKYNILKPKGSLRNRTYTLDRNVVIALQKELPLHNGNVNEAVHKLVSSSLTRVRTPEPSAERITLSNGRTLVRVNDVKRVDASTQKSIDDLMNIISDYGNVKAERDLLLEEVERLKSVEAENKQIKELYKQFVQSIKEFLK